MLSNFRTPDDVNLLFALKCYMLHTSAMVQIKEEIFFRIEKSKRMNFFLIWRVVIRLLICWVAIFLKCNDEALRGEKYAWKVPTSVQIHFGSSKRCTILHQNHMIPSLSLKGKLFCVGTNIALHISPYLNQFHISWIGWSKSTTATFSPTCRRLIFAIFATWSSTWSCTRTWASTSPNWKPWRQRYNNTMGSPGKPLIFN